jgi:hypothetical protein
MGGILAVAVAFGIIFFARKFCDLIGAPLWFAKFLFICASLVGTYFLADAEVPDYNKPWGVWIVAACAASGVILVGFILLNHLEGEEKEANARRAHLDRESH